MDNTVLKKMKVKSGYHGYVLNPPDDYHVNELGIEFDSRNHYEFVHLFVRSRGEFLVGFPEAVLKCSEGGLLWVSYPKSKGKDKFDINRDSMFDLSSGSGYHPVAQVAIDERWSAIRFVEDKPGHFIRNRGVNHE